MSAEKIQEAIARLNALLPLKARQDALPPAMQQVHVQILHSLFQRAAAPTRQELEALLGKAEVDDALARLQRDDLVVLNAAGNEIVGAYPMTTEATEHHLRVDGRQINAMCAVDALSVSPVFGGEVLIESRGHVTGQPIRIRQQGERVMEQMPDSALMVGVRWQQVTACAAHSLCLEMVFLKDVQTAQQWQGDDVEHVSLFTVPEAIAFGAGFFRPLLETHIQ